jgi:hypothetical protein
MKEPDSCWFSGRYLQPARVAEWQVPQACESFHSWLDSLAREVPIGLWQPGIDGSPEWCAARFAKAEREHRAATDIAIRKWSGSLPWPSFDEQVAYWVETRLRVIRWFFRCATPVLPDPHTSNGAASAWLPPSSTSDTLHWLLIDWWSRLGWRFEQARFSHPLVAPCRWFLPLELEETPR